MAGSHERLVLLKFLFPLHSCRAVHAPGVGRERAGTAGFLMTEDGPVEEAGVGGKGGGGDAAASLQKKMRLLSNGIYKAPLYGVVEMLALSCP